MGLAAAGYKPKTIGAPERLLERATSRRNVQGYQSLTKTIQDEYAALAGDSEAFSAPLHGCVGGDTS